MNMNKIAPCLLPAFLVFGLAVRAAAAEGDAGPTEPTAVPASEAEAEPGLPPIHALLVRAIREKRVVIFHYNGHARTVEPHAYGKAGKGELVLHGYQTEGGSVSRPPPGWRTFSVAGIQDLKLGELNFAEARDGYSPNELRLEPLWAELPAISVTE